MRQHGFTFVAILIFLAILGVASMATITSAEFFTRRSAEGELLAIGEEFNQAFLSYYNRSPAGTRRFPAKLEDLVRDPRFPGTVRHLRRVYPDPLTGKTEWGLLKSPEGGLAGVYSKAPGEPLRHIDLLIETAAPPPGTTLSSAPAQSVPEAPVATTYADWRFGYYTAIRQPTPVPSQSSPFSSL